MGRMIHNALLKLKGKNWAILTLNAMAVITVIQNVNSGCLWLDHQPQIPDEAKRFRKF